MSVNKFKSDLLDSILELLWRQWTQLGVAGAVNSKDDWVLDPEALLIFSAHFARYDQRLYDLVIDWLQCNGESINLPRLKALLKRFDHADRKSLGFIAASVKSKKWQPLEPVTQRRFIRLRDKLITEEHRFDSGIFRQ